MPRNKGKGNKRSGGKKGQNTEGIRELVFKEEGQEYAQITRMLGNGRLEAYCFDGKTRLCHIRGQMQKKVWMVVNDVILVSLREYEENKADVIKKYNQDEIYQLKKLKEIPEQLQTEEEKEKKTVGITFGTDEKENESNDDSDDYETIIRRNISSDEELNKSSEEEEEVEDYSMPPPQNRVYTLDDL